MLNTESEEKSESSFLKKTESRAKDAAKDKAKKETKKAILKFLLTTPVGHAILIALVASIVGIILICAFTYVIKKSLFKNSNDAKSSSVSYSQSAVGEGETKIVIDQKQAEGNNNETEVYVMNTSIEYEDEKEKENYIKNISSVLQSYGLNPSSFSDYELEYLGVFYQNGIDFSMYTEEKLKAMIYFLKAEIANKSVDLRKASEMIDSNGNYIKPSWDKLEDNEVYGTIRITRTNIKDNTSKTLTYINEGTFNEYKDNGDTKILEHFTLDAEGNLVIAQWSKTTKTYEYSQEVPEELKKSNEEIYNITTTKFPYRDYINKLVMPYSLLAALMSVSDNPEFAKEVADLAFESEMVIDIKEEATVYTTKTTEEYEPKYQCILDLNYKTIKVIWPDGQQEDSSTQYYSSSHVVDENTTSYDGWKSNPIGRIIDSEFIYEENPYTIIETTINETNRSSIGVVKADTWIEKYEANYGKVTITEETQEGEVETTEGKLEYVGHNEFYGYDAIQDPFKTTVDNFKQSIETYTDKEEILMIVNKLTIGKFDKSIKLTKTDTTKTTYTVGDPTISSHVYSVDEDGKFEKFLDIYSHTGQGNIIGGAEEWLFEMLEENEETVYLSDVMRYLFYKYNGIDYGVTSEEDLDLVNLNTLGFTSIGGGATGRYLRNDDSIGATIANFARMFVNEAASHGYDLLYCQTNRSKGFNLTPYSGARYTKDGNKGDRLTPDATNDFTFDCSSFVSFVYKYTLFPNLSCATTSSMESEFSQYFENIGQYNSSIVQPGDIILDAGSHVMLYVGNNEIIHAQVRKNGGAVIFEELSYVDRNYSNSVILRVKPSAITGKTPNTNITWPDKTVSKLEEVMANSNQTDLTDEEFLYFERLVLAEAGNEGYEGMLAVAAVVINRAEANGFPDTIVDVINQSNQFSTVKNKNGTNPSNIPGADKQGRAAWANVGQAVLDALNGADNVSPKLKDGNKALFFRCDVKERLGEDLFDQRLENKEICYIRNRSNSDNIFTYNYNLFSK